MSFVIDDTISVLFTDPTTVTTTPAPDSDTSAVDATAGPLQVGGIDATYATVDAPDDDVNQVFLSGFGTRLNLGTGDAFVTAAGGGQIVEAADPNDQGTRIIKLGDSTVEYNGATVDTAAEVAGNSSDETVTIAQAAGDQGGSFAYYAHGGAGNDQLVGSNLSDFIRGGAGNDEINGFGGNDLIRGGSGADTVTSGPGADTLYYTADQLDGSVDTFVDFSSGEDKISFDSTQVASLDQISGLGTNSIFVNGAGGTVVVTSDADAIAGDDINFV